MGTKTISLDDDAYEKLRNAKEPGESFSDVVHRLLDPDQPKLTDFTALLDEEAAEEVAAVVERMRREDIEEQRDPLGGTV